MRQKANFFRPDKLQDHTNKGKERRKRRRKEEERRGRKTKKKPIVAFLVFK